MKSKQRLLKYCVALPLVTVLAACDVDQTQEGRLPNVDVDADAGKIPKYDIVKTEEGRLPDVDVDVEGGQMPKFDVQGPDVDIQTKEVDVAMPTGVDVKTKTVEVEVPDDVDVETKTAKVEVPTGIEITTPPDDGNDRVTDNPR